MTWQRLDADLDATPGIVSAYVGRLTAPPAYSRLPTHRHYAASTMKIAVLAALYRAAEAGTLDLDRPVPVDNDFASALPDAPPFTCTASYDNDPAVWKRLGTPTPLRWLAERMIVKSSNLATNIILAHVGLPAVAEAWRLAGARHSVTARGIEDFAARDAGLDNLVTAGDLAALLGAIATGAHPPAPHTAPDGRPGPLATPDTCAAMLDVLFAQQGREDLAAGLPAGTRVAHKNGWVRGVRHGAGVVFPDDAPPYVIVVCTSAVLAPGDDSHRLDGAARRLIAHVSATAWTARHTLDTPTSDTEDTSDARATAGPRHDGLDGTRN